MGGLKVSTMLLLICSKLCQWFASGPLAQGIRPVGLTTGGNLHIWADLKLSLASLLPTGMCMFCVWWYRHDNSDATGDTTIAASISGTLLSFLITFHRHTQPAARFDSQRDIALAGCQRQLFTQGILVGASRVDRRAGLRAVPRL